jgi:hypothetical protein
MVVGASRSQQLIGVGPSKNQDQLLVDRPVGQQQNAAGYELSVAAACGFAQDSLFRSLLPMFVLHGISMTYLSPHQRF